jgi:hypothetical protein
MRCKRRPFCGVIYTIKERCFLPGVVPQCEIAVEIPCHAVGSVVQHIAGKGAKKYFLVLEHPKAGRNVGERTTRNATATVSMRESVVAVVDWWHISSPVPITANTVLTPVKQLATR